MYNSGIYEIYSEVNNSSYIGSSIDIEGRFNHHKSKLRSGHHHNLHLQRAWDKYGEAAFQFRVLMICTEPKDLLIIEQSFIDANCPKYNIALAVGRGGNIKSYPIIVDPEGNLYPAGTNLAAFCREHDLPVNSMYRVIRGKRRQHKGWRLVWAT